MTRLQRRIHTYIWLVGGPLLVVTLVLALAFRASPITVVAPAPPSESTP